MQHRDAASAMPPHIHQFHHPQRLMKSISPSLLVRGSLQVTALLLSFSLGAWVNRPTTPQTVNGPASRGNGSSSSAPASRSTKAVQEQTDAMQMPLSKSPPTMQLSSTSLNGRLLAMVHQMAKLGQPETIATLHRLDQQGNGPEQRITRQLLVSRFAEMDPQTALTYVDTLKGDEYAAQKINALSTWAAKDPRGAAAFFEDQVLTGGIASDEDAMAAAAIAGEWALTQPTAAWEWATNLPEDTRAEALNRVATRLAEVNPQAALKAASSLTDANERAAVMQPLAARWAESSPTQTAVWVQSLTNTAEQASAASGLVESWVSSDPLAVSRWISMLPTGMTKDASISAMITSQALKNDPEAATLWAASIQDATLRSELLAQSLQRWQVHDAAAASRWAATASR